MHLLWPAHSLVRLKDQDAQALLSNSLRQPQLV
jgi:hypothetical protein